MLRRIRPKNIAVGAIRAYQKLLSPMLPPSCRYWPTCSQYTLQAIEKYGLVRGGFMGSLAGSPLQSLVGRRHRPGKMRRIT